MRLQVFRWEENYSSLEQGGREKGGVRNTKAVTRYGGKRPMGMECIRTTAMTWAALDARGMGKKGKRERAGIDDEGSAHRMMQATRHAIRIER